MILTEQSQGFVPHNILLHTTGPKGQTTEKPSQYLVAPLRRLTYILSMHIRIRNIIMKVALTCLRNKWKYCAGVLG